MENMIITEFGESVDKGSEESLWYIERVGRAMVHSFISNGRGTKNLFNGTVSPTHTHKRNNNSVIKISTKYSWKYNDL